MDFSTLSHDSLKLIAVGEYRDGADAAPSRLFFPGDLVMVKSQYENQRSANSRCYGLVISTANKTRQSFERMSPEGQWLTIHEPWISVDVLWSDK